MGKLVIGARTFTLTDEALTQLQETLTNAFMNLPGTWLKFGVHERIDMGHIAIWVSPAHPISMEFDFPAPPGGPEIVGVHPDPDA